MSTFSGKIQEIPNISVDRFDEYNLESEAYFLSHCHFDHMVGLNERDFQNILINNNKFIYVSDVSCVILKKMYPEIRNNIKVLDIYTPTLVMLKDKNISVIPLSAGHCPGSVMFLFECDDIRILYTGDYRIRENDIKKYKFFYNSLDEVKIIDKVYLDTTFFLKSYLRFPKREESLNELCKIIKEWTDKGKNYWVKLITSARYGYEYVFNEVYKQIGMLVHVNRDAYKIYSIIPEMDNSVTTNDSLTQIHSNCGPTYQSICKPCNSILRTIKISAIRWQQDDLEKGLSSLESNTYYVCYSTHASYEEGRGLIKFLKPKSIEACVTYDNSNTNLQIMNSIKEILEEIKSENSDAEDKPKLFETKLEVTEMLSNSVKSNSCSFSDNFGILDSPPRNNTQPDFLLVHKIDLKNLDEASKSIEDNTKLVEMESNILEQISHNFKTELRTFNDIDNLPNEENIIYNVGLQDVDKFEKKREAEDDSDPRETIEKIYSLSSGSSSCSDVIILDSPPREAIEKKQESLKEWKSNSINDIISIIDSPPRKKLK